MITGPTGAIYIESGDLRASMPKDELYGVGQALIHFGLVITSCDRSFRTSSVIWLPAGLSRTSDFI